MRRHSTGKTPVAENSMLKSYLSFSVGIKRSFQTVPKGVAESVRHVASAAPPTDERFRIDRVGLGKVIDGLSKAPSLRHGPAGRKMLSRTGGKKRSSICRWQKGRAQKKQPAQLLAGGQPMGAGGLSTGNLNLPAPAILC